MNPIAQRMNEASVLLEGTPHPELVEILRIGAEEVARLDGLINNPHTESFLEAVRLEAAHQRERWGAPHDREKSAEHWYWLVGYLAGKALRAAIAGDRTKALHHTISSAAALLHWHDVILNDHRPWPLAGKGQDMDLAAREEPPR